MSGTRLVKAIKDNQKEIAAVSAQTAASYATQLVVTEAVKHHAADVWNTLNQYAQDYFVPATGFVGSVVVNGGYNVLHNIATGADWTWQQVGMDTLTRTASAFAVQAAYNGINMLAGRDISEITLMERAGVDTAVNRLGNAALRFAAERAPTLSIFNRRAQVNNAQTYENLLSINSLNVDLEAPAQPQSRTALSPTRRS